MRGFGRILCDAETNMSMIRLDFRGTVAAKLIKHVLLSAQAAISPRYRCEPQQTSLCCCEDCGPKMPLIIRPSVCWSSNQRLLLLCRVYTNFRGTATASLTKYCWCTLPGKETYYRVYDNIPTFWLHSSFIIPLYGCWQ